MAETVETLSTKLDAFSASVDQRFEQVNRRFEQVDRRFDELKAQLGLRIEAVDAKVGLVLERLDELLKRDVANSLAHARLDTRLADHEVRIVALERQSRTRE